MPTSEPPQARFEAAREAYNAGDYEKALAYIDQSLSENPHDARMSSLLGSIMLDNERPGIALLITSGIKDGGSRAKVLKAKALADVGREEDAISVCRAILKRESNFAAAYAVMSACLTNIGEMEEAETASRRALELSPDNVQARNALGHVLLSRGDPEGWAHYAAGVGHHEWRRRRIYAGEPQWDGGSVMKSRHVVVYGEQGLGDQITMAASIQAARRKAPLVLDVHGKLEKLFQRSFVVPTYGTFRDDAPEWRADYDIAASCSLSELRGLFPVKPKCPYLIPELNKVIQWRALLDSKGKGLKVGISWTGGKDKTGKAQRSATLDEMRPLFDVPGITWVSLDYQDRAEEIKASGLPIHHWPWSVETNDYDDTAALVSCLDLVISVPQSVVHLAGALNVPTYCYIKEGYKPHCLLKAGVYDSVELVHGLPVDNLRRFVNGEKAVA